MASITFANLAAALAAGYVEIDLDRGASYVPAASRFSVTLEKPTVGITGASGGTLRAYGEGTTLGNAQTTAVAVLNAQRIAKYGTDDTLQNSSPTPDAATTPSTTTVQPTTSKLTKERN